MKKSTRKCRVCGESQKVLRDDGTCIDCTLRRVKKDFKKGMYGMRFVRRPVGSEKI